MKALADDRPTTPKPYVFVLMPFDDAFNDIYEYGIRGAAEDVGAFADRLDKQLFDESMLERIFNQISKADVLVADMSGRNPNVFYEVGYAHALGKIVILLTRDADDIPFDLKHRPHIVYGGKIAETLRPQLRDRLDWAIKEVAIRKAITIADRLTLLALGTELTVGVAPPGPTIGGTVSNWAFGIPIQVRNDSHESTPRITHIYLLTRSDPKIVPYKLIPESGIPTLFTTPFNITPTYSPSREEELDFFEVRSTDGKIIRQYRLSQAVPEMPRGAIEELSLSLMFKRRDVREATQQMILRIHSGNNVFDYAFNVAINYNGPIAREENETADKLSKKPVKKPGSRQNRR